MDQNLLNWVYNARSSGLAEQEIRQQLLAQGWQEADVNQAIKSVPVSQPNKSAATPNQSGHVVSANVEYSPKNYTIGKHIFSRAWGKTKTIWIHYLPYAIIGLVISIGGAFVSSWGTSQGIIWMSLIITFVSVIVSQLLSLITAIFLTSNELDHSSALSRLGGLALPFIGATILSLFVAYGGLILFAIPGILMLLAFTLMPYVVAKEGLGGLEALKRCYIIARGFRGNIFGAMLMLGLFMLALGIPLIILMIVIFVVSMSNPIGPTIFIMGITAIFMTIWPLYLASYTSILYDDLAAIRPIGIDPEVGEKGKKLMFVYIGIFVLLGLYPIYSIITSFGK
ncbi:MAG: hypothetical protein WCT08_05965 [Patescibacteria group bacterium]|jgi:hypothetical protein